jgi:hypothetical protein
VEKGLPIEQLTEAIGVQRNARVRQSRAEKPLASIVTDAQLLVQGFLGPVEEKQKAKIER